MGIDTMSPAARFSDGSLAQDLFYGTSAHILAEIVSDRCFHCRVERSKILRTRY